MGSHVKIVFWQPRVVIDAQISQAERNMKKAVRVATNICKKKISRPNTSRQSPSRPGEPPKKVTGTLRSNIGGEVVREGDKVLGYLGVKDGVGMGEGEGNYGFELEVGTSKVKARPFLRPTIDDNREKLRKIVITGKE